MVLSLFSLEPDDVEPPDAPDARHATGDSYWAELMAAGVMPLPPIAGGAYEPSPEDWAEYAEMFDRIDGMGFPKPHDAESRRRFQADIREFYTRPDA
jgi:hypothetical protein